MSAITIRQMVDRVAALLEDRLQAHGTDMTAKLKKVRHLLPGKVRQAADRLAQAGLAAQNPKLLVRIDEAVVTSDFDICVRHLMAIAPGTGFLRGVARVAVSVGLGLLVLAMVILAIRALRDGL